MRIKITLLQYRGEPLIEIRGHWEHGALEGLMQAFRAQLPQVNALLYLQTPELDYLDSAALGVIMLNMLELEKKSAKLVLLQPSPEMWNVFRNVALTGLLEIRDELESP